jgi:biotin carboxyl carrier protein
MRISREFVRDGKTVAVTAEHLGADRWRVRVGPVDHLFRAQALGDGGVRLWPEGQAFERSFVAYGAPAGMDFAVRVNGHTHTLAAPGPRRSAGGPGGDGSVRAPMTGTVLEVRCQPGERIAADQTLVVLSAMKMEHKLTAGIDGVVEVVSAKAGATVEQGVALVVVRPVAAAAAP